MLNIKTIIKSLLSNNISKTLAQESLLTLLNLNDNLIRSEEKEMLKFLNDSITSSNKFPTEEYFIQKFETYTQPLKDASVLSDNDFVVHLHLLRTKRENLFNSRQIMELSKDVAENGLSLSHIENLRKRIPTNNSDKNYKQCLSIEEFIKDYKKKQHKSEGLKTFLDAIDSRIGGMEPGSLTTIGAYVANFKTLLATNIAYKNAKELNSNVVYISLEVSKDNILGNMLCRHSANAKFDKYDYLPHEAIRRAKLSEEEMEYLNNVVAVDFFDPKKGQVVILDETDFRSFSFEEIRKTLEEIDDYLEESTGHGIDALFIDHINLCKFNENKVAYKSGEFSEINAYVSFFRKLSMSFRLDTKTNEYKKLAVVLLAQANRDGYYRAEISEGRYDLRALAEANELERASQRIIFIFATEKMKQGNFATIQLLKNRNGETLETPTHIFVDPKAYLVANEKNPFLKVEDLEKLFEEQDSIDVEKLVQSNDR